MRCLRQLPAADKVGMLRIRRASGGGGGSAQAIAIEMPLIMADVAIINWGSDQYACRIRA